MHKALLLGAALGLGPVAAFAADLAPIPAPAHVVMAPFNQWAGFYGGISFGWNWGDGTTVASPQAAPGEVGFIGDSYQGPAFLAAEQRFNDAAAACALLTGCVATDAAFALPGGSILGREQERGGAVFTLNAGYNWQFGSLVFGVEADASFMNRRNERSFVGGGTADYQFDVPMLDSGGEFPQVTQQALQTRGLYDLDPSFNSNARMNWLTTARLRAGYAAGPFLLYATGGLAAGRASMRASGSVAETFAETQRAGEPVGTLSPTGTLGPATTTYTATSATTWRASSSGDTEFGWTVGGGFEWMIKSGFSLKAEYLYYDLGDQTIVAAGTTTTTAGAPGATTTTTTAAPTFRIRQDLDGHIFRVGLNFGFPVPPRPAAPVVAAY